MGSKLASRLFLCCLLSAAAASPAMAGSVNLAWDGSAGATGYNVYSGASSGSYGNPLAVVGATTTTFPGMADCTATFFAVTAYNTAGESGPSNEISSWPRPSVGGTSEPQIAQGAQLTLTINGNNFQPGASVSFSDPAVTAGSVNVVSCSQLTADVTAGASAAIGPIDVSVINVNGVTGTASGLLSVTGGGPPLPDVDNLRRTDTQ